jgi:Fe-S-cluster containining protein
MTKNHLTPRDERIASVVLNCHRQMDQQWQRLLELNAERPMQGLPTMKLACAKGCAACCTFAVEAQESEAVVIAVAIEQTGGDDRQEAITRLLAWEHEFHRWLERNPMPPPVTVQPDQGGKIHVTNNPKHLLWQVSWQIGRKACPFLNMEDHSCGIYDLRPTVCRSFHAIYPPPDAPRHVRLPPDGCFTTDEDLKAGRPGVVYQLNSDLGEIWSGALGKALEKHGLPGERSLLPLAVLKAGRERFGWPPPGDVGQEVPTLEQARQEPSREQKELHS